MDRRPLGPRDHRGEPPSRDQAFTEIFGRRNTHHAHTQPQLGGPRYPNQQGTSYAPVHPARHFSPSQQVYQSSVGVGRPTPSGPGTYDGYAGSLGIGPPPTGPDGSYPTYSYPYKPSVPNGPSAQFDRRSSFNPSVHSNHVSSAQSTYSQVTHPVSGPPVPANSVYYLVPNQQSTSSINLPTSNPGLQQYRTQGSQRSSVQALYQGVQAAYPYPAGGYASDPTVLPEQNGRTGGLTPAQAYQAQVGGDGLADLKANTSDQPSTEVYPSSIPFPTSPAPQSNTHSYSHPASHGSSLSTGPSTQTTQSAGPRGPRLAPPRLPDLSSIMGNGGLGLNAISLEPWNEVALGATTPRPPTADETELGYLSTGLSPGEASGASSVYSPSSSRPGSVNSKHVRTPSESSKRSLGLFDQNRPTFAPLTRIDTTPNLRQTISRPLSSPTSTFEQDAFRRQPSARDSVESFRSVPAPSSPNLPETHDGRSMSFSSASSVTRAEVVSSLRHTPSRSSTHGQYPSGPVSLYPLSSSSSSVGGIKRPATGSITQMTRKYTKVYPALLSRVAEVFQANIFLSERVKDGLAYNDAFTGREAVDLICEIIQTTDRNLALLLGRSLDSQKFFHDVTYDHRLRDNANELYQFKQKALPSSTSFPSTAFHPESENPLDDEASVITQDGPWPSHHAKQLTSLTSSSTIIESSSGLHSPHSPNFRRSISTSQSNGLPPSPNSHPVPEENNLPTGVLVILLDCYSPTCSDNSLCYSSMCPRRTEQAQALNLKNQPGLPVLKKQPSVESLKDAEGSGGELWATSVSQAVLDSVSETERKRQEAINELIATERHFVKDLEYLRDFWIKPLRVSEVIRPAERRDPFVTQVFWNISAIQNNNAALSDALTKRQRAQPVIETIGDILLQHIPLFQPFVEYGTHQAYGKLEFEREKAENAQFVKFVDEVERKPESRKIELNGFLTKPTTRLGRYPLLLKAILKVTDEKNPDQKWIPESITLLEGWLKRVNAGAGKTQNRLDLAHLEQQLRGDKDLPKLRLLDENRELIHKGQLKRRGGAQNETADLDVYLLDNMILLTRTKYSNKVEKTGIYRKPIPLQLLVLATPDEQYNLSKHGIRPKSLLSRTSTSKSTTSSTSAKPEKEGKYGYSITLTSLGKDAYSVTLWSESHIQRKNWLEKIDQQQTLIRDRHRKLDTQVLETVFTGQLKVNCAAPYDAGRRMIYGTDNGVYFSNLTEPDRPPVMVLQLMDVTQVDVLEQFQLLIVLSERSVQTFPLDSLDPKDPTAALKRGKRISSHTTFFKAGICVGKMLVCIVKSSPLSTTIKIMDPIETPIRKKQQGAAFSKLIPSRHDTLKVFKEFYIPTESSSIHFLKTKLCVGCTKGFEIVDLETLDTQGLLDPDDPNLALVHRAFNNAARIPKPIAIYRIESDFLLCYDDFAFYVNKNGWRVGPPRNKSDREWRMDWQGSPTNFALHYPYILAFDPSFVEILDVNTGAFLQVIQGSHIRLLFTDTPPSTVHSAAQLHQLQLQQQQRLAYGRGGTPYNSSDHASGWRPPPPRLPPPPPVNPRNKIVFTIDDKVVEIQPISLR